MSGFPELITRLPVLDLPFPVIEHGATVGAGYRAVIFFDQADRHRART